MRIKDFFINPFKAWLSNNKYHFTIQTHIKNEKHHIFVVEKSVSNVFLKIIGLQNQLPVTFGKA